MTPIGLTTFEYRRPQTDPGQTDLPKHQLLVETEPLLKGYRIIGFADGHVEVVAEMPAGGANIGTQSGSDAAIDEAFRIYREAQVWNTRWQLAIEDEDADAALAALAELEDDFKRVQILLAETGVVLPAFVLAAGQAQQLVVSKKFQDAKTILISHQFAPCGELSEFFSRWHRAKRLKVATGGGEAGAFDPPAAMKADHELPTDSLRQDDDAQVEVVAGEVRPTPPSWQPLPEDGEGVTFEWPIERRGDIRLTHGLVDDSEDEIGGSVIDSGTDTAENPTRGLGLTVVPSGGQLQFTMTSLRGDGTRQTLTSTLAGPQADRFRMRSVRNDQAVRLNEDAHVVLWEGEWMRDGQVIKRAVYFAALRSPGEAQRFDAAKMRTRARVRRAN